MELATNYMGLELRNPLVASASPLSHTVDGIRRLADAGVGAVVLRLAVRGAVAGGGRSELPPR
jgi:dihydroorotate dehydrogenase